MERGSCWAPMSFWGQWTLLIRIFLCIISLYSHFHRTCSAIQRAAWFLCTFVFSWPISPFCFHSLQVQPRPWSPLFHWTVLILPAPFSLSSGSCMASLETMPRGWWSWVSGTVSCYLQLTNFSKPSSGYSACPPGPLLGPQTALFPSALNSQVWSSSLLPAPSSLLASDHLLLCGEKWEPSDIISCQFLPPHLSCFSS